tara:strand:- start:151 stop:615 length:465 start_codon:yes stop_codon:yes gene_type:complete
MHIVLLRPVNYITTFLQGLHIPVGQFKRYSTYFLLTKYVLTVPVAILGFINPSNIVGTKWNYLDAKTRKYILFQVRLFTCWMLAFQTPLELYFALFDKSEARKAFLISELLFETALTYLYKKDMNSHDHPGAVDHVDYNTSIITTILMCICLLE